MSAEIVVLEQRVPLQQLRALVAGGFGDMVKFVADVRRRVIALGGQLHADAELLLLESGSAQEDLWGANYFPGRGREGCIEFTSFINIRPAQANPGMEVVDAALQASIRDLAFELIGTGESLDHAST